ncbi:DUF5959 family protein [Streptomyces coelicoflavus]
MSGNPRPDWRMGPDPVDALLVTGRIHLALYVARLESWANVLDRLDAGEDVAWMEMSRGCRAGRVPSRGAGSGSAGRPWPSSMRRRGWPRRPGPCRWCRR